MQEIKESYETIDIESLNIFCSQYLTSWNQRSTIRCIDRFRLSSDDDFSAVYPATKQPLLSHPTITALGKEKEKQLLILSAYQVMQAVAGIEVVVVNNICADIATTLYPFTIPLQARQVSLTVATDESYHAFVAQEFIADLELYTGISAPVSSEESIAKVPIVAAVKLYSESVEPRLRKTAELIALCFAENFLTEDLYELSKEAQKDSAFQRIIREHIMDEGRHQRFFKKLLSYIWLNLTEADKNLLGKALPKFLDKFLMDLAAMELRDLDLLLGLGLENSECKKILNEVYKNSLPPWRGYKGAFPHAAPSYQLLCDSGILHHEPTRQILQRASWIV